MVLDHVDADTDIGAELSELSEMLEDIEEMIQTQEETMPPSTMCIVCYAVYETVSLPCCSSRVCSDCIGRSVTATARRIGVRGGVPCPSCRTHMEDEFLLRHVDSVTMEMVERWRQAGEEDRPEVVAAKEWKELKRAIAAAFHDSISTLSGPILLLPRLARLYTSYLFPSPNGLWIWVWTKRCPGCQAPVQKNHGCSHMTCLCGTHFCWLCSFYNEQDPTVYTSHMCSPIATFTSNGPFGPLYVFIAGSIFYYCFGSSLATLSARSTALLTRYVPGFAALDSALDSWGAGVAHRVASLIRATLPVSVLRIGAALGRAALSTVTGPYWVISRILDGIGFLLVDIPKWIIRKAIINPISSYVIKPISLLARIVWGATLGPYLNYPLTRLASALLLAKTTIDTAVSSTLSATYATTLALPRLLTTSTSVPYL